MRHVHPLRFESLEARQLLSRAHGPAPARPRVAAAPLVLDGTLAVDNSPGAATTTMNIDGSMTTSVPVAGQLGALGQVHGLWNESVDAYGDYQGPDTLRLRDAKGTFTVEFNNGAAVRPHGKTRGAPQLPTQPDGLRRRRRLCQGIGKRLDRADHKRRPDRGRHHDVAHEKYLIASSSRARRRPRARSEIELAHPACACPTSSLSSPWY